MGKHQLTQIILRILFIVINGVVIFHTYSKGYLVNTIGVSFFFMFQVFLFVDYVSKQFIDIEKSLDCLLYDDYSYTISKAKRRNPVQNKTALLLEKHRKKSILKTSEALILTNIIESLGIGILILRKSSQEEIEIFQINNAFTNFLKIPKLYNWNLLQGKIGNLTSFISKWESVKHTITLDINGNKENFFLKTSVTQTNQYEYLIVSLETIQQLIDKKEKEAWFKLMNVMSHEIINTITPISSLAENLDSLLQEEIDDETFVEISQGLKIIKRRSYHLTSFVDTYRKLAELPLPQKEKIDLINVIQNTLLLFEQEFSSKKIKIKFNNSTELYINADKQQIEQVIINLLSNCMYALVDIDNPQITITLLQDNNRVHLTITDNGMGVSKEIKDNIFIPYFTTRKDGSGIGLTLSKSIIEAHNGSIHFKSEKGKTDFIMTFTN
jgi:nitrogen fixation/metabolism regulation signal transduction histidine kinase